MGDQPTVAKSDDNWQAECDADTLATAAEIRNDSKRLKKAKVELAKKAKAAQQAALENNVKIGMKKAFPKDDDNPGSHKKGY